MELPIINILKRRSELETAQLEDDVVEALFSITNNIAMHGGTAIWRCYKGKRFSKDIDIYCWESNFKEIFRQAMEKAEIEVSKYREKGMTFIHVRKGDTEIKIEPNNVEKHAILAPYEKIDGTKTNILVLSPEDLILEKIETYSDRGGYKDLYDITVLINLVKEPGKVKGPLDKFVREIRKPDEKFQTYAEFRTLIYAGVAPSFENMVGLIKRWIT